MNKLLVIGGPTSTGKTGLALKLAKKFAGELISADSRQVYRGMDIGTGKDLPKNSEFKVKSSKLGIGSYNFYGIPVWLLDVVESDQEFSVAQYYDRAWKIIKDIWKRGKLPILVGGTGFYIKAVIDGVATLGVPQNAPLRALLEQKAKEEGIEGLFNELSSLDPEKAARMNLSDQKNPRRLIRAIEVARWKIEVADWKKAEKKPLPPEFDLLMVGLKTATDGLYRRIDRRVEERLAQGAEKEVRRLLAQGYSWDLPAMSALGYGEFRSLIEGKATLEEVKKRWQSAEHAYARRQLTWFKGEKRIKWFDIGKKDFASQVEKQVKQWYISN